MSSEKTRADELFELYAAHHSEMSNYWRSAQQCLARLRNALQQYVGLPDTYQSGQKHEPWFPIYSFDSGTRTATKVDSPFDVQTMNAQGELETAIGVALSHQENSFPKTIMYAPVLIRPDRDGFHVALSTDRVQEMLIVAEAPDYTPFCEAFLDLVTTELQRSPFDRDAGAFAEKKPIGFLA